MDLEMTCYQYIQQYTILQKIKTNSIYIYIYIYITKN